MNAVKQQGKVLGKLVDDLGADPEVDKRWLAIAKTDLQKGIMSLVRSIAKSESF